MTFNFNLSSKGIKKNIILSLTDNSRKKTYSFHTNLSIIPTEWDVEKQRPSNIYIKKHKRLNQTLNYIKLYLAEYVRSKRSNADPEDYKTELSKLLKDICENRIPDLPSDSLLTYMSLYIENRKETICQSTYKRYMVFLHVIELYEGETSRRLYIDAINEDFIPNFIRFGKRENYSNNTIYRTIHFVKTILNFAERKGVKTAVREIELRREKQNREMVTLSEREIAQIYQAEVPTELLAARDWLLISCYTGQRFSDFIQFDMRMINNIDGTDCLMFTQKKTNKDITLPIHPMVMKIVGKNNDKFPDRISLCDYNQQIKRIAKLSNINNVITTKKRIGFRSNNIEVEKWETITSHIGRRSFATNFYGKIPTPLLMEATGHSTEQMFLRYINPVDNERILSLGSFFDKMHKDLL